MERSIIEENSNKRSMNESSELDSFDSGFASGSKSLLRGPDSAPSVGRPAQSNKNASNSPMEVQDSPLDLSMDTKAPLPKRPKKSHSIDIYEDYTEALVLTGMRPNELDNVYKDYDEDIYKYMCWQEEYFFTGTSRDYLSKQKVIEPRMRENLIEWLSDVVHYADLTTSTLFLAVSLFDRMLSRVECGLSNLQLLGCGALLIAAKVECRYSLTIEELCNLSDGIYDEKQIRRAERVIFLTLKCNILVPGADTFSNFYHLQHPSSEGRKKHIISLLKYLLQLSCLYYDFIHFLPSRVGAAAFVLANYVIELEEVEFRLSQAAKKEGRDVQPTPGNMLSDEQYAELDTSCWPAEMRTLTGIEPEQIREPIKLLAEMHELSKTQPKRHTIFTRFRNCGASTIKMPSRLPFDPLHINVVPSSSTTRFSLCRSM